MRKHFQYLKYVLRHKWFVFQAGCMIDASLWRLIIHDWSKFLPSEWFGYVDYFYGPKEPPHLEGQVGIRPNRDANIVDYREKKKVKFDLAWRKHQVRNKHHWQYWVLLNDHPSTSRLLNSHTNKWSGRAIGEEDCLEMPEKYIKEMVADWCGAGKAITGKWRVYSWYLDNKDMILLHPITRVRVEELVEQAHLIFPRR